MKRAMFIVLVLMLSFGLSMPFAQTSGTDEKEKAFQVKTKDVSEPVLVNKVNPSYPKEAKEDKVQGTVIVDITIDTEGSVIEAKATKSPDARLSTAAIDAIKQWKFKPALNKAGKPVQVLATVTVNFKLK